jgi:hypothetical protein
MARWETGGVIRGLARWAALAATLLLAPAPAAAQTFADWAAVVVAGDWRAHGGKPTEAFDNARRDVSTTLVGLGFRPQNLRQFSVKPQNDTTTAPGLSETNAVYEALEQAATTARGGCLVYVTSHGDPSGVLVGEDIVPPRVLGQIVDGACGQRPTVVVISACFSGVFVPALAGANRMVLTAARRDRSSFGCGEADRYPYFDDCFLSSANEARDFGALGRAVQACVAARETKEGMKPPSQPQLSIGADLRPVLPLFVFKAREFSAPSLSGTQ